MLVEFSHLCGELLIIIIMRKLLLPFLLLASSIAPSIASDDDAIYLSKDGSYQNSHRSESSPEFNANIQDNKSVVVESSESTDFTVEITDSNSGNVVYDGSTYDGSQHETNSLPDGNYTIKITTSEDTYSGEFVI